MSNEMSERVWPGLREYPWAWLVLIVAVILGVRSTALNIAAQPKFAMDDCLRGQEIALLKDFYQGRASPQSSFLANDEAVYVRAARKLAQGEVAIDYNGDFIDQVRSRAKDYEFFAISPVYRLAYELAQQTPADRPSFVSYRSMVFPAWGVPAMRLTGCNADGLDWLRWSMLPWRIAGILAAGILAFSLARRYKVLALSLASLLVAADAQLSQAGSFFMPDMPGAALLLMSLCLLVRMCNKPVLWIAILLGLLLGLTALVKADLLYVLPVCLVIAPLAVASPQRRNVFKYLGVTFVCYALVLGAWATRNHAYTDAWFITSKDSINLYLGNSPDAPGRNYRFGTSAKEQAEIDRIPMTRSAELRTHGPEIALRSHFQALVAAEFRADPVRIAVMFKDRVNIFLHSGGVAHFPWLGKYSGNLSLLIMCVAVFCSALSWWGRWRQAKPLLIVGSAFVTSFTIVSMVFFEERYLSHLFSLACVITVVSITQVLNTLKTHHSTISRHIALATTLWRKRR